MTAQLAPISLTSTIPDELAGLFGTFGAGLVGSWIAMTLYGLSLAQTYVYFHEYPDDHWWNKGLVCLLWLLNTLHAAFSSYAVYQPLVTNAFNIPAIIAASWSWAAYVGTRFTLHCVVILYLTVLCVRLNNRRVRPYLFAALLFFILPDFAFGIDAVVRIGLTKEFADYNNFEDSTTVPALALQAVTDMLLTITFCVTLNKQKTGFRRTNTMINTLLAYAVNRGVLTFLAALVELMLVVAQRNSIWYSAVEYITAGRKYISILADCWELLTWVVTVYVNSLLAILNSRHSARQSATTSSLMSAIPLSKIAFRGTAEQSDGDARASRQVTTDLDGDGGPRNTCEDTVDIVDFKRTLTSSLNNV